MEICVINYIQLCAYYTITLKELDKYKVSKIRLWNGEFTKQRSVDIIWYYIATANAQLQSI